MDLARNLKRGIYLGTYFIFEKVLIIRDEKSIEIHPILIYNCFGQ
jgi:hypothetical protein